MRIQGGMSKSRTVGPEVRAGRNGLVCDRLKRNSACRRDARWVGSLVSRENAWVVPVHGNQSLYYTVEPPRAGIFSLREAASLYSPDSLIYLGSVDTAHYFAVDVTEPTESERWLRLDHGLTFGNLWNVGALMDPFEASLLAYARGMCHWHRRTRFCGRCGSETRSDPAGHLRQCANHSCEEMFRPRVDPAVIVLVHRGESCLLGNHSGWPRDNYSTFAGFVEPGETLEQGVLREVFEETGIKVKNLRYHSSQPWPFPASLMLGFFAEAEIGELKLSEDELNDARWFSRSEIGLAMDDSQWFKLPPRISIARRLVEDWARQEEL